LNVTLPAGEDWYSLFHPSQVFKAGGQYSVDLTLSTAAAFGRQKSIIPLHISNALLNNGDQESTGSYTLMMHSPDLSGNLVKKEIRRNKQSGFEVTYQADGDELHFTVSAVNETVIIFLRGLNGTLRVNEYSQVYIENST
jgi:hypothetical protein